MADNTNIEWADSTFNPWIGCTKVSPACDHCYAENLMDTRMHKVKWGAGQPRQRTSVQNWNLPLRWEREHAQFYAEHGRRRRVFCASLADVFDKEVPEQWRYDLWQLIHQTPNLDWLLLTKRIGNAKQPEVYRTLSWPHNVWLGATICKQAEADRDIPKLLGVPAKVRFLSIEPLLGPIDLTDLVQKSGLGEHHYSALECDVDPEDDEWNGATINWVIVGGESGANARPMHPNWVRSLRDQCKAAGVPFLFKQWGEFKPVGRKELNVFSTPTQGYIHPSMKYGELPYTKSGGIPSDDELEAAGCAYVARVGKKAAGRLLDGITHNEFPRGPYA